MPAVIIYPHQLFKDAPLLTEAKQQRWPIYLVEESLMLTHNPIHIQKLMFHKLSLDAYETWLRGEGQQVIRLTLAEYPKTADVFTRLKQDGVEQIHVMDTTDDYLEQAIFKSGLFRVWYDTPLFILKKAEAVERYTSSKRFMTTFYKRLRQDLQILMEDGEPIGGRYSFDSDNRQKLPKGVVLPSDISFIQNDEVVAAAAWAKNAGVEVYGEARCWVPYTFTDAEKFLQEFLRVRLAAFGTYEDALTTDNVRLFHSTLSPLLNCGLLTPATVVSETLAYASKHDIPFNSLEGFIRQVIGWREFIRASYEVDGRTMRTSNFFKHTKPLSPGFWSGATDVAPLDHVINTALTYGYTHHIERLMVMGNFMLLSKTHPDEVYRWFMAMYVDAYDWVMVPNVYGMSQFADGGLFATKPYISGASYLKKMSDYKRGEWEALWTALYWNFIHTHREFFTRNHRLSMMPKLLEKMSPDTRAAHLALAETYLHQTSAQ